MQNHILSTEIILLHLYFFINLILPTKVGTCTPNTPSPHATPLLSFLSFLIGDSFYILQIPLRPYVSFE